MITKEDVLSRVRTMGDIMTTDVGIDYGKGQTNIDNKTGIRFGVIPMQDVDYWHDESEPCYPCESCEFQPGLEEDEMPEECEYCEPSSFIVNTKELTAEQTTDGCDIFIHKSEFFTYAQFCSPCAPGACYLLNPLEAPLKNNRAYCLGHDWFENGAPYPIYSVATGKLITK